MVVFIIIMIYKKNTTVGTIINEVPTRVAKEASASLHRYCGRVKI